MIRILHRIKYGKTLAGCVVALAVVIGYCGLRWRVHVNSTSLIREAERSLRQRDNARARETLKTLLWFDPQQYQALLITGISLNADRKFPEAIAVLERIPDTSEQFEQGGIALASSLNHDKQFDRAESVLRRHLELFPRSVATCEELVRLNLKLLRQREATTFLLEFWSRGWDDFGALPLLLELEVKTATPHEAVPVLEAADRQHPRQPAVVLALAHAYSMMGKTEQAQAQFENALQLKPQDFLTRLLAAEFFFNRGDVESSQRLLKIESVKPLEDDRYWWSCLTYVERNPVEAGIVATADEYRWSSYRVHAAGARNGWLVPHPLYEGLGSTPAERQVAYRAICKVSDTLQVETDEIDRGFRMPDRRTSAAGKPNNV